MKIAILQGAFLPVPPIQGGAVEKLWFAKARVFASKGISVFYIAKMHPEQANRELIEGIDFCRIKGYDAPKGLLARLWCDFRYSVRACFNLPADTDVVVTNTFFSPILIPLFRGSAVYVDVARMPKGQMWLYKRASRLRATSSAVATAITRQSSSLSCKVKVIPNPLPYTQVESDRLRTIMFSVKQNVALFVGRVHPEKGVHLLASSSFRLAELGWKLKIVGPHQIEAGGGGDAYLSHLKQTFHQSAEFVGPIYNDKILSQYYCEAKVFIYPSLAVDGETFGLAPLEAMAHGAVPLVSDLQCFGDFIVDGLNGVTFQIDFDSESVTSDRIEECMTRLVADSRLPDMSTNAHRVLESHNLAVVSELFVEDFKSVVGAARSQI